MHVVKKIPWKCVDIDVIFPNLNKENWNLIPTSMKVRKERKWGRGPVCLVARWQCVPCVSLLGDQKARSACSQAGDGVVWFPRRRLSLTSAANHRERSPAAETRLLLKRLAVTRLAQRGAGGRVGSAGGVEGWACQVAAVVVFKVFCVCSLPDTTAQRFWICLWEVLQWGFYREWYAKRIKTVT